MALLSMSRAVIYEQLRAGRLRSDKQARARRIPPVAATAEYVALLNAMWQGSPEPLLRTNPSAKQILDDVPERTLLKARSSVWTMCTLIGMCGRKTLVCRTTEGHHHHRPVIRTYSVVKGQDEVLSGGLETSTWADSRNPCWWPGDLLVGSGQGFDSLAGEGLLKAVRVALGGDQVGVVE